MRKIGILGGLSHSWVSVNRTRTFVIDAVRKTGELYFLDDPACTVLKEELDLVINFCGPEGWKENVFDCPRLFFIHGGAILDEKFLKANIPNISSKDAIVVSCTSDIAVLRSFCKTDFENILLLPLPVDLSNFFSVDKKAAKEMLGLDPDVLSIGLVARLLPQKNPHVFLRMIDMLEKQLRREVKPIVIGNFWIDYPILDYRTNAYPEYFKELVKSLHLEERASLLSADMPNEELNFLFNAMDLIIHPTNSIDENFGYVPVEAMACGTPVIGTAYGGLKDTLNNDFCVQIPTYTTSNGIRMDIRGSMPRMLQLIDTVSKGDLREPCTDWVARHYASDVFDRNVAQIVDKLISEFNTGTRYKIETHPPDENLATDDLPPTSDGIGWQHYARSIGQYVSGRDITFTMQDYVYRDCPYLRCDEHTVERDDPAWPARYRLSPEEMHVFDYLEGDRILTYETCAQQGFDPALVQKMVANGLLVISKTTDDGNSIDLSDPLA